MSLTTSSPETITATGANNVINGTQNTFQASDTITGNPNGTNTLKLVDTGTAAWTLPAATVTGVQTVSLQNINGVGAVKEVSTIVLNGMAANTTFSVGDLVLTNSTGAAVTGAQMATVLTGGTVTNLTLSGGAGGSTRPTDFEVGTLGNTSSTVVFTAQNAGALTDLTIGGTSQSGVNGVQILTFATNPGNANNTLSVNINGVTATSAAAGNTNAAALQNEVSTLATAINLAAGSNIATWDGALSIIVNAPRTVTISALTAGGTSNTTTMTPSFAPVVQTLELGATVPGATTAVTFRLNGVQYSTAALAADTVDALGAAYVAAINTAVGRTVASYVDATNILTINNGTFGGLAFTNVGSGNTEKTFGVTTASTGYVAPNTATQTIVQGVTATGFVDTVTASNFTGATSFISDKSSSEVTFNSLTSAQSVTKDGGSGALNTTWGATGVAPVLNIANGSTGGNIAVTAANATSLTINSTGSANTIGTLNAPASATALNINATTNLATGAITATAVTTITASGAATLVNLGTLPGAVTTINGSGLTTGGITVTLTNTVTSFTGGAGVDTVTTVAGTGATAAINGGGGAGDILNVADTTSISTIANGARYTNFEMLRNSTNDNVNVSNVSGITAIQLAGGGGAVGMTAAQAANITNRATNDTLTLALTTDTGTADSLTVTLLNSTATTSAASLTGVTVNGFETMNVVSSSGSVGNFNSLTFAAGDKLKVVNLSGAFPISVTTSNITTTGGTAFNASGVTYSAANSTTPAFTITGNLVKGSSVRGSDLVDSITTTAAIAGVSTEFVLYEAGAGNDAIVSTAGAINNIAAQANGSVRIDGGSGTDTLTLSEAAGVTLVDTNFQYLTNIETIVLDTGNNAISFTSGAFFNTNFGANTTTTLTLGAAANAAANTVNLTGFAGNVSLTLNAAAASVNSQNVTTGSGNDTVSVTVTALTNGSLNLNTGAGNDRITIGTHATNLNTGGLNITGGLGADTYTLSTLPLDGDLVKVVYNIAAGDSVIGNNDVLNNYGLTDASGDKGNILQLEGSAVAAANVANQSVTGYTAGELQYSISNGLMTFAGTSAAGLTSDAKAAIAQAVITTNLATVAFTQTNSDATVDTFVFNNNTIADTYIKLVGVTALGLGADSGTAGYVNIG